LDLTDIDVSNLTSLHGVFAHLKKVRTIDITGWDTSNIVDMSYMFSGCNMLKEIIGIEDIDTHNVTTMEGMFYNSWSIERLDLNSWDVSNVENMYNMFRDCYHLRELNISDWDVRRLKIMK